MSLTDAEKNRLKKVRLSGLNKPKRTPSHKTKKGVVAVRDGGKMKIIRFGDQKMGHNYSDEARKSFKARHAKNIKKGKTSAAYWANKMFWSGKGGSKSPRLNHRSRSSVNNHIDYPLQHTFKRYPVPRKVFPVLLSGGLSASISLDSQYKRRFRRSINPVAIKSFISLMLPDTLQGLHALAHIDKLTLIKQ